MNRPTPKKTDLNTANPVQPLALAENLEHLEHALSVAHQGWFKLDIQTGEVTTSLGLIELLGLKLTHEQHKIRPWLKHIDPDDRHAVLRLSLNCLKTDTTQSLECRWQTAEGHWLNLQCIVEVSARDDQQQPLRILGVVTDITERKRNERVLRILAESGARDENIFRLVVRELAVTYNVRYAMISALNPNTDNMAETVAVWVDNTYMDNFPYSLANTPCAEIIRKGACFYPDNVQKLFPRDHLLAIRGARSYLGVPLMSRQNEVLGLLAIIDDKPMTEQLQTLTLLNSLATRVAIELERRAAYQKQRLSFRIFNEANEGIVITDEDGTIVDVNPAFSDISGYSRDDVIGKNPRLLNSGIQSKEFYGQMWQALKTHGHWQGEIWNRRKNGEVYAEMLTISALKTEDGHSVQYVGLFSDITQDLEQQKQLEIMAHFDALTQLPNRTLFADRFHHAVAHSKRTNRLLAICFIDLDSFKPVNDTYGHDVGDQLLMEVAERIKSHLREEDTVSRFGGDEFAILLSDLNTIMDCEEVLTRIHQSLSKPFAIDKHMISISASSGFTLYPLDMADLDTLLRHADHAMYEAKQAGRNNFFLFDARKAQEIINHRNALNEIRQGLANGEFCLYYQPKVNMRTGKVFGAEALLRWEHPTKGLISPATFLPLIDEIDLETTVGDWVIRDTLRQMEAWRTQGLKLEVSINISSRHLQTSSFITNLDELLSQYPDMDSDNLQLEVLESSALGDVHTIRKIIKTCRDRLGVHTALDDFGTGYSSLTHLRTLPASTIKIDQSFVRDMLDDPNDYAIVDGVIRLAQAFDRKIIAEGVETNEHGLMLLAMGCDLAQGYAIAKPMPGSAVPGWLKNYRPNQVWLDCAEKQLSAEQAKVKLLRLTLNHWVSHFETNIHSKPGIREHWPIMADNKCHCGLWLKRMREDHLFNNVIQGRLEQQHAALHTLAYELLLKYQAGHYDKAKTGLSALKATQHQICEILEKAIV